MHKGNGHGRGIPHVKIDDVKQTIAQDAAQESVQANSATGNVFTIDLSGENNHVNLNKATFVLDSDIDQTNTSVQTINQDAANAVVGTVYDKHGKAAGTVTVEDVGQGIGQDASQGSVQVNSAVGNTLKINLSGEHNHANLNKAVFVLESDIDQSNFSFQNIGQNADNKAAAKVVDEAGKDAGVVVVDDAFQWASQDASQQSVQSNSALGNLLSLDLSGEHNQANLNGAEFNLSSAIDQFNASVQDISQMAGNSVAATDWQM